MLENLLKYRFRALVAVAVLGSLLSWADSSYAVPIAQGGEGLSLYAKGGDVRVTYSGYSGSYYSDSLFGTKSSGEKINIFNNHRSKVGTTIDLGTFAAGTRLDFSMHVDNTNDDFFVGAAGLNADNHAHARVEAQADGSALVSFEDLLNGLPVGWDYNDLSFTIDNVTVGTAPPAIKTSSVSTREPAQVGEADSPQKFDQSGSQSESQSQSQSPQPQPIQVPEPGTLLLLAESLAAAAAAKFLVYRRGAAA